MLSRNHRRTNTAPSIATVLSSENASETLHSGDGTTSRGSGSSTGGGAAKLIKKRFSTNAIFGNLRRASLTGSARRGSSSSSFSSNVQNYDQILVDDVEAEVLNAYSLGVQTGTSLQEVSKHANSMINVLNGASSSARSKMGPVAAKAVFGTVTVLLERAVDANSAFAMLAKDILKECATERDNGKHSSSEIPAQLVRTGALDLLPKFVETSNLFLDPMLSLIGIFHEAENRLFWGPTAVMKSGIVEACLSRIPFMNEFQLWKVTNNLGPVLSSDPQALATFAGSPNSSLQKSLASAIKDLDQIGGEGVVKTRHKLNYILQLISLFDEEEDGEEAREKQSLRDPLASIKSPLDLATPSGISNPELNVSL